ncbi:MAG: alpha/beta hydrolase [Verrucomicrobiota bacterium]|nr:alpha/beta hydrolase [Verrucomicrobiota bacterium]
MHDLGFVHEFIPATGGSARVLLLLHGTGGDESDLIPLARDLDPAAALLSPRGNVLENGMPRFFRRFAEGVFDEEDVIRRANELADFVAAAAAKYDFDILRVTAVGYSNGANIAAAMMLLRPEVLHSAVLFRAMATLTNPPVPDLSGKRILLSAGDNDPIIPLANVRSLAALLQQSGADVHLEIQTAGHRLIAEDVAVARVWMLS